MHHKSFSLDYNYASWVFPYIHILTQTAGVVEYTDFSAER